MARYADATNVFGGPEKIHHKYAILRDHCDRVGRDFDEIERSTLQTVRLSPDETGRAETTTQVVDRFGELGDAGAQHVIFAVRDVWRPGVLEQIGREKTLNDQIVQNLTAAANQFKPMWS